MPYPRNRKEWRLPVRGDWVVVRSWDLETDEETLIDPRLPAQLRRWSSDVFYGRVLLDIGRTLWGVVDHGRGQKDVWVRLLPRLEDAFRRGQLVLVKRRVRENPSSPGNDAESDSAAELLEQQKKLDAAKAARDASGGGSGSRKPKTWVAVRLIDQDGQAVTGEAYRLVLPDGSVQDGTLDDSGEAFVNGIDPGECQVTFPNLDAKEWKPA